MDFNERDGHTQQRTPQGYARVGERTGVDDNEISAVELGLVHPVNEGVFGIGLKAIQLSRRLHTFSDLRIYVVQRCIAVDFRLAGTQQIQVRAVEYENFHDNAAPKSI